MEKIAIHCQTQEEYDQLLEIYEKKGWKRRNGHHPKWFIFFYEGVCVEFWDNFTHATIGKYQVDWYKVLTFKELLEMEETSFKRGDRVLVSSNPNATHRHERIYLTTIKWANMPYVCVSNDDEKDFNAWNMFTTTPRECIKPLPVKKELTLQEIADKFGVKVEDLRIKD